MGCEFHDRPEIASAAEGLGVLDDDGDVALMGKIGEGQEPLGEAGLGVGAAVAGLEVDVEDLNEA